MPRLLRPAEREDPFQRLGELLVLLEGGQWVGSMLEEGQAEQLLVRPPASEAGVPWRLILTSFWFLASDHLLTRSGDPQDVRDPALASLPGEIIRSVQVRFKDYALCITTDHHQLVVLTNKLRWVPEDDPPLWEIITPGHPEVEGVIVHKNGWIEFD